MAETVSIARDWAVILLAVEGLILSLVPLFLYLKATQGLGKLLPQVRPFLRRVRTGSHKVEQGVLRVADRVAAPFVAAQAGYEAVRAFCQAYRRRSG